jgi:LytR cell envelope-related transcriptional attenuator
MSLVQEIGAYAGFAAVVGLAVLSALYFSQARDVKRLREWAGRAPERAAEQEARIAAQTEAAEQRAAAAAGGGPAVAAPAARPQAASPAAAAPVPPPAAAAAAATVPPPPAAGAASQPPTLPSSRPAPASSTPILGQVAQQDPWYRRIHWPAPRFIALIVVGILVIGAGAAYGISQLTKKDTTSSFASQQVAGPRDTSHSNSDHPAQPISPKSITVAVLNGTTVTGLAATMADKVEQAGFRRGNTNNALTQGQQAESVVEYSDGNVRQARLVAAKLGISQVEKIDPRTQGLAGDATVTVIVGADKASGSG